jgi:hypothetical protein
MYDFMILTQKYVCEISIIIRKFQMYLRIYFEE